MRTPFVTPLSVLLGLALAVVPAVGLAGPCPEVDAAKAMIKSRQAFKADDPQAPRTPQEKEIQAPRSLAGSKPSDKEIQAPRTPQEKEVQAPRSLASAKTSANLAKARALILEAEKECQKGNSAVAAQRAEAAMELLTR